MERFCSDCGKKFELTQGEIDFYASKGLSLPKRCKECREKNKAKKQIRDNSLKTNSIDTVQNPAFKAPKSKNKFNFKKLTCIIFTILFLLFGRFLLKNNNKLFNQSEKTTATYTDSNIISYSENKPEIRTSVQKTSSNTTFYDEVNEDFQAFEATKQQHSQYHFRNRDRLNDHYYKHGVDMGFDSASSYEAAANAVINNPDALSKHEAEDNDMVYFIQSSGEIVFVSGDGFIRTYFISDKDYFDRQ